MGLQFAPGEMRVPSRLASVLASAIQYALAYLVGLPIFLLFKLADRVKRGRRAAKIPATTP